MIDLIQKLNQFGGKWPYQEAAEQLIKQQAEITILREQVEKLTKERDKAVRTLEIAGYTDSGGELWKPPLGPSASPLLQQLAALAEQNEKLREVLVEAKSMVGHPDNIAIINSALSLPNLATPVLNRIKAEAYREAAEIVENTDVYTFIHGGTCYDDGGLSLSSAAMAIRAKADELEQSK